MSVQLVLPNMLRCREIIGLNETTDNTFDQRKWNFSDGSVRLNIRIITAMRYHAQELRR